MAAIHLHKLFSAAMLAITMVSIAAECHAANYSSDLLQKMATAMNLEVEECDTSYTLPYHDRNVKVRVKSHVVEHIGYAIFDDSLRCTVINPQIADFVERYWLSLDVPLKREKSVSAQLNEDRFCFVDGGLTSVDDIQREECRSFGIRTSEKEVHLVWEFAGGKSCYITFPIDAQLILGRGMMENDRRLPAEINAVDVAHAHNKEASAGADTPKRMHIADSYLIPELSATRYFTHDSIGEESPIFGADYPAESITNIFTGSDVSDAKDIRLDITHIIFGPSQQPIATTVAQFVDYCLATGCKPYVGIMGIDDQNAEALVVMRNSAVGYNHVLRVTIPMECLRSGSGVATARLNAFIPTSNVKNLFKDL